MAQGARMIRTSLQRLAVVLVLACPAFAAHAQVAPEAAEALMRDSGFWKSLGDVGPQAGKGLAEGIAQSGARVDPAERERLVAAMTAAFSAERLRAVTRSVIARTLRPEHLPALQAWYGSPRGRVFTRMEEAASGEDTAAIMPRGNDVLARATPARRTLIADLVAASRFAETMATITIGTTVATYGALAAASGTRVPPLEQVRAQLEAQRPRMEREFVPFGAALFAATYARAGDADLAEYLRFTRSPAGAHFVAVGIEALDAAMREGATAFGTAAAGRSI